MNEDTIKLLNELTDKLGVGAGELLSNYTSGYFVDAISYTVLGIIIFLFAKTIDSSKVFIDEDLLPVGKFVKYACFTAGLLLIFGNAPVIFYPEGAATQALILNLKP